MSSNSYRTFYVVLFFLLNVFSSHSQEKPAVEIHKSKKTEVVSGVKYILHTVEKGQTLYAIAKAYEKNLSDIVIENPNAIDGIKPGQVLKIPVDKPKPALNPVAVKIDTTGIRLHKVEQGQTLYSLSKMYGTTVDKLIELNPELKDGLKIGQSIKTAEPKPKTVPKTVSATTATVVTTPKPIVKPVEPNKPPLDKTKPTATVIPEKPLTTTVSTISEIPSGGLTNVYPGSLKEEYNIAFILPFQSNSANAMEVEKLISKEVEFSNKTNIALEFYEGAMLALDSLKKENLKAKIFVYDIDDTDSLGVENLLKKPELAEMDLMIGPLYGSNFIPVSRFAKDHMIPIVSPFIQVNKILFDNPYVCKVSPSNSLQIEQVAHYVVDSFHTQNIILINNGNTKESSFISTFKNSSKAALIENNHSVTDTIKEAKNFPAMLEMFQPGKTNVVVLPSNNQSYVTEFVSRLNSTAEKNKVVLFGMQSWMNYDNLDFEYLNALSLHIPATSNINYEDTLTTHFIAGFREQYKADPSLYSYVGYDVTYTFVSALKQYGSGFLNNIASIKHKGMVNNYDFIQSVSTKSGFENKSVVILKYKDYKLVKAN